MIRFIPLIFVVAACFQVDNLEDRSLVTSADLNVKSVKTYYTDEYGDQRDKDGDLVGYAVFGNDGSLMNIKTTNLKLTMFQSNARSINKYSGIPVNRILWAIDGGAYGQQWKNINAFLTKGPDYPYQLSNEKATEAVQREEMYTKSGGEYSFEIDNYDKPSYIKTSSVMPMFGDHKEMSSRSLTRFGYDDDGRVVLLDIEESTDPVGWPTNNYRELFHYDAAGRLTQYERDEQVVKVSRNPEGFIDLIEVIKNDDIARWYTFNYLENGLRSGSQAFNGEGQLEFSIDYVYEYYR